jgi:hypothetical protein
VSVDTLARFVTYLAEMVNDVLHRYGLQSKAVSAHASAANPL